MTFKNKIAAPVTDPGNANSDRDQIQSGRAAMYISGPWQFINMRSKMKDDWDIAPLPKGKAGSISWVAGSGFGISTTTKYPKESWAVLKALTSTDSLKKVASAGRGYPGRKSAVEAFYKKDALPQHQDVIGEQLKSAKPYRTNPTWQEITTQLQSSLVDPITLEGKSVPDTIKAAEAGLPVADRPGHPAGQPLGRPLGARPSWPPGRGRQARAPGRSRKGMVRTMQGRRGLSLATREALAAYLFILPSFLGFAIFLLVPMVMSAGISLYDWELLRPPVFIGLENYRDLTRDPLFVKVLVNTAYYTFGLVPLNIVVSLGLALWLNTKLRGLTFYRLGLLPAGGHGDGGGLADLEVDVRASAGDRRRRAGAVRIVRPELAGRPRLGDAVVDHPRPLEGLRLQHGALPGRSAGHPRHPLRSRHDRRRQRLAALLEDHPAAADAGACSWP